jgi:hypothetical protein
MILVLISLVASVNSSQIPVESLVFLVLLSIAGIFGVVIRGGVQLAVAGASVADLLGTTLLLWPYIVQPSFSGIPELILPFGLLLASYLALRHSPGRWLTSWLPVRGIHARRLAAAIALFAIWSPCLQILVPIGRENIGDFPTALWSFCFLGSLILYLLPLGKLLADAKLDPAS